MLIVLLLAFWEISALYIVRTPTWPPVTDVFVAWFNNVIDGTLPLHLFATLWRQMLGYFLGRPAGRHDRAWRWGTIACFTTCSSRWSR